MAESLCVFIADGLLHELKARISKFGVSYGEGHHAFMSENEGYLVLIYPCRRNDILVEYEVESIEKIQKITGSKEFSGYIFELRRALSLSACNSFIRFTKGHLADLPVAIDDGYSSVCTVAKAINNKSFLSEYMYGG